MASCVPFAGFFRIFTLIIYSLEYILAVSSARFSGLSRAKLIRLQSVYKKIELLRDLKYYNGEIRDHISIAGSSLIVFN